jgi:alginate O-acetyltransferase complex protein AlgJ
MGADGEPWRPSRSADVLLLGDSFTNIYSLATMGWGEAAGFAEQLSHALQRPIDRIVQNDQAAHATRAMLARDLSSGDDRLAGKRVVVWQFAARELAAGDWKIIPLPPTR